jgi:MFS family permease
MIINNVQEKHNPGRPSPGHGAGSRASILLGTQTLFNVGFYAVVPFIAVVLTGDFGLGATAVGLVLGVRTFSQQGLFVVGGALADRFGPRGIILLGCAVRSVGFLALSAALWPTRPVVWLFVAGTALTGFGGALFSPGLNVLLGTLQGARDEAGHRGASLFAWLAVTGEVGAVVGPLLGARLLGWGFATVAGAGAGFFVAVGVGLAVLLPRVDVPRAAEGRHTLVWHALRDRRFTAFAALHAADLLSYNQLYLALPLAIASAGGGAGVVALMFAWASVLTLGLQLPVARWTARLGAPRALRLGYLAHVSAFLLLAVGAVASGPGAASLALLAIAVTCIMLGHLVVNPTGLGLVPGFARGRATGVYFGLLATGGGIAVLLGNLVAGALFEAGRAAEAPPVAPLLPWVFLATLPLAAAVLVPRVLRASGVDR